MSQKPEEIMELSKKPNLVEILVGSLAPNVWGYNEVKEAVLLQLFGGGYTTKPETREEMHILIIGDPGLGKVRLLDAARRIAPLSATVYDSLSNTAVKRARNGLLIVEELDQMPSKDHEAMQLLLEQAPVSVLAAASPKFGRFDNYKPLAEQFDIPARIIAKFDLIFPVRDILDSEIDRSIADKIIGIREGKKTEDTRPQLDEDTLRDYISYARNNANLTLKPGTQVAERIREYYVSLRSRGKGGAVAATPRQLETLIRLSEASAKRRLSDEVSVYDVERSIRLIEFVLKEIATDDESGELDIDSIVTDHPKGGQKRMKTIETLIYALSESNPDRMAPLAAILQAAETEEIESKEAERLIEELRKKGIIYEPKYGHYSPSEEKK